MRRIARSPSAQAGSSAARAEAIILRFFLTGILLAVFGGTLVAAEYRVILRDGSWLRAQSKPVVEDGKARIRLMAGLLTVVPESQVDWAASESYNRKRPAASTKPAGTLPQPVKPLPTTTIQMVSDPEAVAAAAPAAPPGTESAAEAPPPPVPSPEPQRNDSQLRAQIRQMDQEIEALRQQKADLDERAHSAIHLDDAAKLRAQAQEVQNKIQAARAKQSGLILQLPGRRP